MLEESGMWEEYEKLAGFYEIGEEAMMEIVRRRVMKNYLAR